jgi:glycosyltransferase involved in cell wall biosynthesis
VAEVRELLGLNDGDCLLGYFGFVHESKGADVLVRALAQLDEHFHLVFIGGRTGSSDSANNQAFLKRLEALIVELDLAGRVHWTGFLSDSRVSTYLVAADIVVMPYRDGASLRRGTLMAALAHGCPLITTQPAVAAPELVHGQNVWLAPVNDAAALKDAIRQLAAAPALRGQLGQAAAAVAELFTWERIAEKTAGFFQEIVKR